MNAQHGLLRSIERLVFEQRMLTGLTVVYGNAREYDSVTVGNAREVIKTQEGIVPDVRPLTAHTLYDLASLTKLFTAVSVLQLVERGMLRLTDTVAAADARFSQLYNTTIQEALTFQAVLKSPQRVDAQPDFDSAQRQVFAIYRSEHMPERLYSDMNALLLSYVVEGVTGQDFYDYVKENILIPVGMQRTFAQVPAERVDDCVDYNLEHRIIEGDYQVLDDQPAGQPHDPKARLLLRGGRLCGHAGLFSTAQDMACFAQALLQGKLIARDTLLGMGVNRTGYNDQRGYRQYLGQLCFAKSPVQRLSELPSWMGQRAIGMSGYTGNHFALDPELGVFDIFLGNRCHNRVSRIVPETAAQALGLADDGSGSVRWPDGRQVLSSFQYIYKKDEMLHQPVYQCLLDSGMIGGISRGT